MHNVLPVMFFGRGNPNECRAAQSYTEGWRKTGNQLSKPRSVHRQRQSGSQSWGGHMPTPYEWANRFEGEAKAIMLAGESKAMIHYEALGKDPMLSIPTPDHYVPLLYVLGARRGDAVSSPVEGIDGGSISMLAVRIDSRSAE